MRGPFGLPGLRFGFIGMAADYAGHPSSRIMTGLGPNADVRTSALRG